MMDAKGDISISMIVIASIGVIVLSIVAALVIQSGSDVTDARSCQNVGSCAASADACGPDSIAGATMDCEQVTGSEDAVCCIRN